MNQGYVSKHRKADGSESVVETFFDDEFCRTKITIDGLPETFYDC